MANVKNDIDKMIKKLRAMQKDVSKELQVVGDKAVELIKKRTRLGYGVEKQGGIKKKLKPLSTDYRKQRSKDKLSGNTSPGKSNLTHSGDMLDDLTAKKKDADTVEIKFKTAKSDKVAGYVSEDRPFNNLSKPEIKQLTKFLDESVKKAIKKNK